MRRVAKETGRVALLILAVLAKVAEDYQNMPVACAGCHRTLPRKAMCHLWDIPRYAEQWWLDF